MQKIFIATIFIIFQLISYSALALTVSSPPIYQVKASDFIEKFNTLNKQYRYNLKPIKKPKEPRSRYEITYLLTPNIYLTIKSDFELVTELKLACDQFANNKSAGMNKCQQSIQLISEAFDPDFVLSDFKHNKVCKSTDKVNSCLYEFNDIMYTQENEQNTQSLRFIISPFIGFPVRRTMGSRPIYQIKSSDFIEKFNTLNKQYRYDLEPRNFRSENNYLLSSFRSNSDLTINSESNFVTGLKFTCYHFSINRSANRSADMNKCYQSIQLISQAFDPDFVLSDFERNKVCKFTDEGSYSCSYNSQNVGYTLEYKKSERILSFIISPLTSYSILPDARSPLPTYQIQESDFIEKFDTLNQQYLYDLQPFNFQSEITYLLTPNIYITMKNRYGMVTELKLVCDRFANNKSAGMNKCQQSIQLMSKAFDPDFVLSDFKRNKVCESTNKVKSCSYMFNQVSYTQEHDLDDQSLRFSISPMREYRW